MTNKELIEKLSTLPLGARIWLEIHLPDKQLSFPLDEVINTKLAGIVLLADLDK